MHNYRKSVPFHEHQTSCSEMGTQETMQLKLELSVINADPRVVLPALLLICYIMLLLCSSDVHMSVAL